MLSQTVEYALRAMLHLAGLAGGTATSGSIARHAHVPAGYVSKVMRDLVVARLVTSFRGPRGGFSLSREARAITILDVVNAVEPLRRVRACPLDTARSAGWCGLHRRVDRAIADVERAFGDTTLAEVLGAAGSSGACAGPGGGRASGPAGS